MTPAPEFLTYLESLPQDEKLANGMTVAELVAAIKAGEAEIIVMEEGPDGTSQVAS